MASSTSTNLKTSLLSMSLSKDPVKMVPNKNKSNNNNSGSTLVSSAAKVLLGLVLGSALVFAALYCMQHSGISAGNFRGKSGAHFGAAVRGDEGKNSHTMTVTKTTTTTTIVLKSDLGLDDSRQFRKSDNDMMRAGNLGPAEELLKEEETEEKKEGEVDVEIFEYNGDSYWVDRATGDLFIPDAEDALYPVFRKDIDDPANFPWRHLAPRAVIGHVDSFNPVKVEFFAVDESAEEDETMAGAEDEHEKKPEEVDVEVFEYNGDSYWVDRATGDLYMPDAEDEKYPVYHKGVDNTADFPWRHLAPRAVIGHVDSFDPVKVEFFAVDESAEEDEKMAGAEDEHEKKPGEVDVEVFEYDGESYWIDKFTGDLYAPDSEDEKYPVYHKGADNPADFPWRDLAPRSIIGRVISMDPVKVEFFNDAEEDREDDAAEEDREGNAEIDLSLLEDLKDDAVFKSMDTDGSGAVTLVEFRAWYDENCAGSDLRENYERPQLCALALSPMLPHLFN